MQLDLSKNSFASKAGVIAIGGKGRTGGQRGEPSVSVDNGNLSK